MNNQGTKAPSRTEPTEVDGAGKTLFALFAPVKGFSSRLRVFVVKSVFICGSFFSGGIFFIANYRGLKRIIPD